MDDRTAQLNEALPDRYELVRELGRGGMATVYLARDRRHDRQVAIKVLSPELISGVAARRFLREIELAARLAHPHILPLLDSGLVDDQPFYVMPFVEGRSLRERLDEEGTLPVSEALRIARSVGEALAHAHDAGVVHRDIKPGNILLTEGVAVVTDFGIATALERDTDKQLTRPGHSLGTPGYMSPEQAAGDSDVDARTDQYALACVLFEMLAGDPPYTGRSLRAILGRQLSQPVPRISALRETVPAALDDVLTKALARNPADRHSTMSDFLEALGRAATSGGDRGAAEARDRRPGIRPVTWVALAVVALVAAVAWLGPDLGGGGVADDDVRGDTMRYAIFPFNYARGTGTIPLETLLHDALDRWEEISVVDAFETGEAVERTGEEELDPDDAARIALAEGAGRFVMARVTSLSDSLLWLQARLYEVRGEGPHRLRSPTVRSPVTLEGADRALAQLATELLLREAPAPNGRGAGAGTSSLEAYQAFDYGQRAVEEWRLARADSGFTTATAFDPDFTEAQLWVALSRAWQEEDRAAWAPAARRAELASEELSPRDAKMAEAIALQAEGRTPEACSTWRELTTEHREDFSSWYGLAHCLSEDTVVVRDETSPTGWSFRTSYHSAIEAYQEAFTRLPSMLESFYPDNYRALRQILLISGTTLRRGVAASGEHDRFWAYPQWRGDTLAYVPMEGPEAFFRGDADSRERTAEAIRQMRRKFREVAVTWVAEAPASARAREALAYGMMMNGEPGALDTLLRAREMASDDAERFDLARSEVWVRLAVSLPGDPDGLRRVRSLADSLLEDASSELEKHPTNAAGLATLLGRANLAASWMRRASPSDDSELLEPARADARALLVFSSLGGPRDSVRQLERRVERAIRSVVSPDERPGERGAWLVRPATMMFPDLRFSSEAELAFDPVIAAQRALAEGDTTTARERLDIFATYRETSLSFVRTLDTQLAEMRLLIELGELERARNWVEPTLSVLPQVDLQRLSEPVSAGPLVRIAALRAELASELDLPEEAARWARAVTILWSDADVFLRPRLEALDSMIR